MAEKLELWCFCMLPAFRSPYSKSLRNDKYKSNVAARLVVQDSSANTDREYFLAVSSVKSSRPKEHVSPRDRSDDLAKCTNAGPPSVQRREAMQLFFFSGLFLSQLVQQSGAVALDGDDNVRLPAWAEVGLENGRLRSCEGRAPCISTSAFRSPSRFMPPWSVFAHLLLLFPCRVAQLGPPDLLCMQFIELQLQFCPSGAVVPMSSCPIGRNRLVMHSIHSIHSIRFCSVRFTRPIGFHTQEIFRIGGPIW